MLARDVIFGEKAADDYILWSAEVTKESEISITTILMIRDVIFDLK